MCGIVGLWGERTGANALIGACRALHHRGPDDFGIWRDDRAGLSLGQTRLAILDTSPAGHQPMRSACGRYVIVFNGEIYNHLELRASIARTGALVREQQHPVYATAGGSEFAEPAAYAGASWRGHSDTETLLACIAEWGLQPTLRAATGMFAFAVWDRHARKLSLARDRLGEKPLYYGYVNGHFAFASELKALAALPGFRGDIDRGALMLLLRHNYIPAPRSVYEGVAKLTPGTWVEIDTQVQRTRTLPSPRTYWSALEAAARGVADPLHFESDTQAVAALEGELSRAVAGQMIADVPLGAFLSGGVDSSLVVALMQAQSSRPVKSFAIGFREQGFDEAKHAGAVARHLGTEHTELYVSPHDALAVIPRLPTIYDEPFSDSSQIPTYLLAQLARNRVTVALSGDGGDELFGGYTRYLLAARLWRKIEHLSPGLRRGIAALVTMLPPHAWDGLYRVVAAMIPTSIRWDAPGDKLHKGASLLKASNGLALYRGIVTHWDPAEVVVHATEPATLLSTAPPELPTLSHCMMLMDVLMYMPDDILVKVDRAAMAASLETRVPFLDHGLFEFAWRLPLHYKIRGGTGKWLLRQVLHKHIPPVLVDRPKMGFGVPIGQWLRGPLREWAEGLLSEHRLTQEGYFHPEPIRRKWREHLSGIRNWQYHLWDVLMFQAWLESDRA